MFTLHSSRLAADIFNSVTPKGKKKSMASAHAAPAFDEATVKSYREAALSLYSFYINTTFSFANLELKHPDLWKERQSAVLQLSGVRSHIDKWAGHFLTPFTNLPADLVKTGRRLVKLKQKLDSHLEIIIKDPGNQEEIEEFKDDLKSFIDKIKDYPEDVNNLISDIGESLAHFKGDIVIIDTIASNVLKVEKSYQDKIDSIQGNIEVQNKNIALGGSLTGVGAGFVIVGIIGAFFTGGLTCVLFVPGGGMIIAGAVILDNALKAKKQYETLKQEYSDDKTSICTIHTQLENISKKESGGIKTSFATILDPWSRTVAYLNAVVTDIETLNADTSSNQWAEIKNTLDTTMESWETYLTEIEKLTMQFQVTQVSLDVNMTEKQITGELSKARPMNLKEFARAFR